MDLTLVLASGTGFSMTFLLDCICQLLSPLLRPDKRPFFCLWPSIHSSQSLCIAIMATQHSPPLSPSQHGLPEMTPPFTVSTRAPPTSSYHIFSSIYFFEVSKTCQTGDPFGIYTSPRIPTSVATQTSEALMQTRKFPHD